MLLAALNGADEPNVNVGFCRVLDAELDTNGFGVDVLLLADHTLSFCPVLLNKLGAGAVKLFAGCMLLAVGSGFVDKPLVPPRVPIFPIVIVLDDSELPAIEPSEFTAIAFPVSPLETTNPLLPPKVVGKLLLAPNVVPVDRLKVLVLVLLLSVTPKGDWNKAGESFVVVELVPNVNGNLGFSGAAGIVKAADGGVGLLGPLFPKLNSGADVALLFDSLVWNIGADVVVPIGCWNNVAVAVLVSGDLNMEKLGALVVGRAVLCDCCVNRFIEGLVFALVSNNLVFDDIPNVKVGVVFGFSADDAGESTELTGVSFFTSVAG